MSYYHLIRVFQKKLVFATNPQKPTQIQSIIIMAAGFELRPDAILAALPPEKQSLRKLLQTYIPPETCRGQGGYVLTDRFNPVEYLIARTIQK